MANCFLKAEGLLSEHTPIPGAQGCRIHAARFLPLCAKRSAVAPPTPPSLLFWKLQASVLNAVRIKLKEKISRFGM